MDRGQILVDGSHLFHSIARIRRDPEAKFGSRKLRLGALAHHLRNPLAHYLGPYARVSFYFRRGDPRLKVLLEIPDIKVVGRKRHWQVIECGVRTQTIPEDQLLRLDLEYRDVYPRGEKGLDMRLACDALTMASMGRVADFGFMFNDRDFVPLLHSLQRLGCYTYLATLDGTPPHQTLLDVCDRYISLAGQLNDIFEPDK